MNGKCVYQKVNARRVQQRAPFYFSVFNVLSSSSSSSSFFCALLTTDRDEEKNRDDFFIFFTIGLLDFSFFLHEYK